MGILEDRILRIMELRGSGYNSEAIGKELGLPADIIDDYENSFRKNLSEMVAQGVKNLESLSNGIGVSPVAVDIGLRFYNIRADTRISRAQRVHRNERKEQIRKLFEEGINSVYEISQRLGISPVTVAAYGIEIGIKFPSYKPRGDKQKNIEKIRELAEKGVAVEDIAREVELKESTVRSYASDEGIKLPRRESDKQRNIEKIRELASEGKSIEDIAREVELKEGTVRGYAYGEGIKLPRREGDKLPKARKSKFDSEEVIAERARKALQNGCNSLEELCKTAKISCRGLFKLTRKYGIELPQGLEPWKTRPELDELIEHGLSLGEIAEINGLSSQRIRQYIEQSGQYKQWKKKRKEVKSESKKRKSELNNERSNVLYFLEELTKQKAKEAGWEYEKALEYINKIKHKDGRSYSFDELLPLFRNYKQAQEKGKKLSLDELKKGTRFNYAAGVGRILEGVDLEPMHWKIENRQVTPKDKKEAIKRAVSLPMNNRDIAYFLGINYHVVTNNLVVLGLNKKRLRVPHKIKRFGDDSLTYRLASQIYEGKDLCRFNRDEIAEVLDTSREVVDYTFRNREEISKKIVKVLRVLYRDKKINRPYLLLGRRS